MSYDSNRPLAGTLAHAHALAEPTPDTADEPEAEWIGIAVSGLVAAADWLTRQIAEAREYPTNVGQSDLEEEQPRVLDVIVNERTIENLRSGLNDIATASRSLLARGMAAWLDAEVEEARRYNESHAPSLSLVVKTAQVERFRGDLRRLASLLQEVRHEQG